MSLQTHLFRRRTAATFAVPAVAIAVVLGWASLSWACGVFAEQPTAAVSPIRTTAASDVTVTGAGWKPATLVALSLSSDGTAEVQPLGAATAAADGSFSARVHIANQAAGVYYVSAVQGAQRTNVPVELTEAGAILRAGQWNGLQGNGDVPSLGEVDRPKPQGSHFPLGAVALASGIVVLFATVTAFELRGQRASS